MSESVTDGVRDAGSPERTRLDELQHAGLRRPTLRAVAPTGRADDEAPATSWEQHYRWSVIASDTLAAVLAVVVVGILLANRIGLGASEHLPAQAAATVAVLLISLMVGRAWRTTVLGQGVEEFRRLGRGLFGGTVALALAALATGDNDGRSWIFIVMPTVALLAFPQRYLLRRWLHHARREGRCLLPVIAAGSVAATEDLIRRTRKAPHIGWRVEAVCANSSTPEAASVLDVPVIGHLGDLAEHVRRGGYRFVAVTADGYWNPARLQQLAWDLEGSGTEMVVAPVLMEVAGPRLHVSGVLGMPLLQVSAPTFTGARKTVKGIFDRAAALVLTTLLLPVLPLIALLIKLDSRGPVFYRQERVGKDGKPFRMVKFRTMVVDADQIRTTLLAESQGSGPMFKLRRDPRVTRMGRLLRKYSLDELPQLANVLGGTMSLVGPRPPLPEEIRSYGRDAQRRLLVKPGLTGLWQVSGRSDLPWDEAVRLDLRYVEDWSLALDAVILWKTVRAVLGGRGAY
jgi:exopolysaccharide biosynthesis polyprenyl glycosylphosphotransferase